MQTKPTWAQGVLATLRTKLRGTKPAAPSTPAAPVAAEPAPSPAPEPVAGAQPPAKER